MAAYAVCRPVLGIGPYDEVAAAPLLGHAGTPMSVGPVGQGSGSCVGNGHPMAAALAAPLRSHVGSGSAPVAGPTGAGSVPAAPGSGQHRLPHSPQALASTDGSGHLRPSASSFCESVGGVKRPPLGLPADPVVLARRRLNPKARDASPAAVRPPKWEPTKFAGPATRPGKVPGQLFIAR